MYQRKFAPKKLKPLNPRANIPQRGNTQQKFNIQQKKNNTPIVIGSIIAIALILILIVALSSGGEKKAPVAKAKAKDFSALIKEAKDLENRGIALYDSVEGDANKGNLSEQKKIEFADKVKEAMGLMSKAQGYYSQIQNEGGTIPSDARVDSLGERISRARYLLKLKLE